MDLVLHKRCLKRTLAPKSSIVLCAVLDKYRNEVTDMHYSKCIP